MAISLRPRPCQVWSISGMPLLWLSSSSFLFPAPPGPAYRFGCGGALPFLLHGTCIRMAGIRLQLSSVYLEADGRRRTVHHHHHHHHHHRYTHARPTSGFVCFLALPQNRSCVRHGSSSALCSARRPLMARRRLVGRLVCARLRIIIAHDEHAPVAPVQQSHCGIALPERATSDDGEICCCSFSSLPARRGSLWLIDG
ncbi:hypothetical protein IWX46DRAFT_124576 [Phyllosticta citricarpa]|uniref:Secreted protein n=1 Tax=Phyllosticta citricarpa TaxID=55181 RepID=A0ABR1M7G8_9PEZI